MYYLLILCLALSALLAINALVTLGIAALWRFIRPVTLRWTAAARAQVIFILRLFPLAGALVSVVALIVPSYLTYEPWPPDEVVPVKLAALTLISASGLGLAVWRGLASWRATRLLVANWLREADAVCLETTPIPAYRIRHPFPVLAVVGAFRPRLFIAGQLLDTLAPEEIAAAIRHEAGHLAMRDNLKRVLLRACRDALTIIPCGRSLDDAWAEAAEAAADEYAARAGAPVALDLAAALVKIARMIPQGAKPTMPAGAFLIGEEADGVVWRVQRLAQLAEAGQASEARDAAITDFALSTGMGAFFAVMIYVAVSSDLLATVHLRLEQIFRLLS